MIVVLCGLHATSTCAQDVTLEGGSATTDNQSNAAFSQVLPNLSDAREQLLHDLGNTGFLRDFARVKIRGAIRIGPQFNAPSCTSCHTRGGRGAMRLTSHPRGSDAVVKISLPKGRSKVAGAPVPVPVLGTQIHDHAVKGMQPEARVAVRWDIHHGSYGDGTPYELRSPRLSVVTRGRKLPRETLYSLRRAPPVFGVGLLEAISSDRILALADPNDGDADGISGKANVVWDVEKHTYALGRFGYKAGIPTLKQQVAAAYTNDMGISNSLFRGRDRKVDIPPRTVDATTFYTATLAVPRARDQADSGVVRGKALFGSMGCGGCHVMELETSIGVSAALSNTTIHPFSDLLLHDMGAGLADNRPEFGATGREWRTAPLWGIGLTATVLAPRAENYLHDGRARTLEEAILWHGGEAAAAQQAFVTASAAAREDLIRFLRSL